MKWDSRRRGMQFGEAEYEFVGCNKNFVFTHRWKGQGIQSKGRDYSYSVSGDMGCRRVIWLSLLN